MFHPNTATIFAQTLAASDWFDERTGTDANAVALARAEGATCLGPFAHDEFGLVPGDRPASLWLFPDGTKLVIGDDGNWIAPPSRVARKRAGRWVRVSDGTPCLGA